MKKSLIALAVLATAAGVASAQSSVTMFGIVDAAIQHVNNNGGASVTRLVSGANATSRFGVRGTEDLGGGSYASFWLEAGYQADDGTGQATNTNNQTTGTSAATAGTQGLMFNRRSTVSLGGGWGELRVGRDYTPQFYNTNVADPFGSVGVGAALPFVVNNAKFPTGVRASNSIGYLLPANIGGFYGQAQYYLGENLSTAANKDDGSGYGLRLGWANGPFDVALALSRTRYLVGDTDQNNILGVWNGGFAKIMGEYSFDKAVFTTGGGRQKGTGYTIAAVVPVGPGEVKASYSQYKFDVAGAASPTAKKFALGYVHNLSKRTALYVTAARVNNSNGSAVAVGSGAGAFGPNNNSTGYDLGIRHAF